MSHYGDFMKSVDTGERPRHGRKNSIQSPAKQVISSSDSIKGCFLILLGGGVSVSGKQCGSKEILDECI